MVSREASAIWPVTNVAIQYQQIFAISQALPGSASIKMIFTINVIHGGFGAGFISFLLFRYLQVSNVATLNEIFGFF